MKVEAIVMHVPAEQTWPPAHGRAQAPQFAGSLVRLTHWIPEQLPDMFGHALCGEVHVLKETHTPATQVLPVQQLRPHPPQWAALLSVSTQPAPQSVWRRRC